MRAIVPRVEATKPGYFFLVLVVCFFVYGVRAGSPRPIYIIYNTGNENMNNNGIICIYNGVEIYDNDISILCSEYENQYTDIEERIKEPVFFTGLMIYINQHLFKAIIKDKYNNDYSALNEIFYKCFLPVCVKYNRIPTLLNFCSMTGLSNSYLSSIISGTYVSGDRVKPETCETCKKWKEECENALLDFTLYRNSVAGIFALKSAHQWRETSPEPPQLDIIQQSTPEEIAARYQDAKRPELPELE